MYKFMTVSRRNITADSYELAAVTSRANTQTSTINKRTSAI